MTPQFLPGFTRTSLAAMFAVLGYRHGAEIGVRQGAYSLVLCQANPDLELLCVDLWGHYASNPKMYSQDRHDENYRIALERLAPYKAQLIRASSTDEHAWDDDLDFVYLDANHTYEFVRDDLKHWSRKVTRGGIVSGDDLHAPGVRRALEEWTDRIGVKVYATDTQDRGKRRNGERFTSWFYRQP